MNVRTGRRVKGRFVGRVKWTLDSAAEWRLNGTTLKAEMASRAIASVGGTSDTHTTELSITLEEGEYRLYVDIFERKWEEVSK